MKSKRKSTKSKISAKALREFADFRRIANKAVQKALEENKRIEVTENVQYAK